MGMLVGREADAVLAMLDVPGMRRSLACSIEVSL